MKNILFYAPFDNRSRDTETLMAEFRKQGHRVIFLNQREGKGIHSFLIPKGIEVYTYSPGVQNIWFRHLLNIAYLIFFCWKHNIRIVYSHLEPANFVAVFAQFFIRAKVFICRHHSDLYALTGKDQDFSYKIIYRLARKIIVVSQSAKKHMIEHEFVNADKIIVINLAYDFSLYNEPNKEKVAALKEELKSSIVLITIGHLNALKKPLDSLKVLSELIRKGYDAKLIYLGRGELADEIASQSSALGFENNVVLSGFVTNVIDYLTVSSFLLHPSVSESSCVVVKEAALVGLPVIAVNNVGDFNDYIVNGVNGFLIDKDSFVDGSARIVAEFHDQPSILDSMTEKLKSDVLKLFDVKNVILHYNSLNK